MLKLTIVIVLTALTVDTASAAPADVPMTGQTLCYDSIGAEIVCAGTGQDGGKRTGALWPSPRFIAGTGAEAGCVTDRLTGLMWVQAQTPIDNSAFRQWYDALNFVENGTWCGFSDWRLPNVNELKSLLNFDAVNQYMWLIAQGLGNVRPDVFWTSTTYAANPDYAFNVSLDTGGTFANLKSGTYAVWPVRAGR